MNEEKSLTEIGGYTGLVNRYYEKINEEINKILEDNEYSRTSHAFAHWFLMNIRGLNNESISELITDDFDDWSIDAINIDYDNEVIELYQFKLPISQKKIEGDITQEEILKFLHGYNICSSGTYPDRTNDCLKNKIEEIVKSDIYTYKLIYVAYNNGLGYHAKETLDSELRKIKSTGNDIEYLIYDKNKITNIYHYNKRKRGDFSIKLKQLATGTGYMENNEISCYSIYASLGEIAEVCEKYSDSIFDENVRLFHGISNPYNKEIMNTAINDGENFHLYNNGIVILSTDVKSNDMRKEIKITNPKVVNGCQTMNSLVEAKKKSNNLTGVVQVKIIKILDPAIRQNTSIFLNSQTEIKDSYLISNLPIIINLEDDLDQQGYFLERQANQVQYIKETLVSKKQIEDKFGIGYSKVIRLDEAIQVYATFFEDMAPVAKLNKAKLFNSKANLEKIFKNINAERVIISNNIYKKICEVITMYRKYKRNNSKDEILKYLNIDKSLINEYLFMNTADLFLLSIISKIIEKEICPYDRIGKCDKANDLETWEKHVNDSLNKYIKDAIDVMHECIINDKTGNPPAVLTKNAIFHKQLMAFINQKYK
ncbi:AIPR family protein [Paraclostridium bifermentans]|uniref:AIPR family protein n=1 Tax=Paraclostridium bifermentans TaxID=1490 RepID=UPI00041C9747|nr:AIPR family protein [Paraclostridium bifermentans]